MRYKLVLLMSVVNFIVLVSCREDKDATVKADLVTKAKQEKDFAGVNFTVEKGVVYLSGVCATDKSRKTVEATVKGLYGVNKAVSTISVAPVVIGTDQSLKEAVDSILKKYAAVEATTRDSVVVLQGKVQPGKVQTLLAAVKSLKPKNVENRLTTEQ